MNRSALSSWNHLRLWENPIHRRKSFALLTVQPVTGVRCVSIGKRGAFVLSSSSPRMRSMRRAFFCSSAALRWEGGVSMVQGASRGIGLEFVSRRSLPTSLVSSLCFESRGRVLV
ncbi:hypothetical protein BHE74_00015685 [Ensete ventricosum]|nr:hypothetical protein BHE74_00015685 [Ensete ventricosum]